MSASRTRRFLSATIALTLAAPLAVASTGAVAAQDEGQFCKDTRIVFFPGGSPGGPFAQVVYNGAVAAEKAFGPEVEYVWSEWLMENMLTQFQAAVATQPDGIAIMGHPGDVSFKPLVDEAVEQGIIVTVMNTELPETQADYAAIGTGYVGQILYDAGWDLTKEMIKRSGLAPGDKVFVWGLLAEPGRGERTRGIVEALEDSGWVRDEDLIYLEMTAEINSDSALGVPVYVGIASSNSDMKAAVFDHGAMTATAQNYLEAAGQSPEDVYVAGFDLAVTTVDAIKSGYTDLVIDQQQWLQGFEAVTQICLTDKYQFGGLTINTGGAFADIDNVDSLAELVEQQIR